MLVTFTKAATKRYTVAIEREHGPALVRRYAPGFDDLMPHDVAHYVVEEQFGIVRGVWGQLAAGGGGLFTPAPQDNSLRHQRRAQRIAATGRSDMARSERLVGITVTAWERTVGRATHDVTPQPGEVDPDELAGAVRRMGEVASRWQALPRGGSLIFEWPAALTIDPAKSRRGRADRRRSAARNPRHDRRGRR